MTIEQRLYTVEEFEAIAALPENADHRLELINGEIVEKLPTEEHGICATNILGPLWNWNQQAKQGRVGMEIRYRKPDDRYNARLPDISFSRARRPIVTKGSVPELPDLAIEVKSPDDTVKEMRDKAAYYLANGVTLVWLVFPEQRIVEVYKADAQHILTEKDVLAADDLLPGFSLPVRDVFADPLAG
ncbi:MAG: Uma2 family endonuclease [bacterium]|nr:Uma2 family endonuclease [bacterium]